MFLDIVKFLWFGYKVKLLLFFFGGGELLSPIGGAQHFNWSFRA
jgi:hypothetical protein